MPAWSSACEGEGEDRSTLALILSSVWALARAMSRPPADGDVRWTGPMQVREVHRHGAQGRVAAEARHTWTPGVRWKRKRGHAARADRFILGARARATCNEA